MARRGTEGHVVVVGSNNFDMVVKADRLPKEGENVMATGLKFFPGGKGGNQAVAVRRLGAKATFIGCVGEDVFGEFLLRNLRASGIESRWVKRTKKVSTGCAFIPVLPSGQNAIVVDVGANLELTPRDVERARAAIERADALLTVLELKLETVEAALRLARKAAKHTVLDAGPPRRFSEELLMLADVVSPNETELEFISGESVSDRASAEAAAQKLLDRGAKTVVVKLGRDGAMLVSPRGAKHFPAFRVQAVDPTAAGDAFSAALTVELARGAAMEEAIRFANAAGALACTKLGAQPSMPTRREIDTLVGRNNC
ncbi:MAG: ribokinase [Acidobacteria bacterium]|nr:MAG: ribokinase [Acidobacteriota bacterium]